MLTEIIKHAADWGIQTGGLWGAGILMALESMIAPVPSEVVMPPLGMAVHRGEYFWWTAMIATSAGSLAGSLISYYLGYFGGKPLVMKVGRFLLVNEHHLDLTTQWFGRWGSLTVFISRFIPVVRHFVSIPAGIARMNLLKFCLYTVLGATMWNGLLLLAGFYIEDIWETKIMPWRGRIDVAIIALLLIGVIAWYWLHLRKPRQLTPDSNP
jgi:membrane protein DedA with SNARE-associated domain